MKKYEFISVLAQETTKEVVKNRDEWMKYLTTAARLYKYPFREQLLIYAQRPDATACASIEIWNERMHCWVNKGAKGIALIDEDDAHGKRLKYVFDFRLCRKQWTGEMSLQKVAGKQRRSSLMKGNRPKMNWTT